MQKIIATAIASIVLAGCGSSAPDEGDLRAYLEPKFQGCKNIEVVNVKKINGFTEGEASKYYNVEYRYEVRIKSTKEYEQLGKIYAEEKKGADEFRRKGAELDQKLDELRRNIPMAAHLAYPSEEERPVKEQYLKELEALKAERDRFGRESSAYWEKTKVLEAPDAIVSNFYLDGCPNKMNPALPVSPAFPPERGVLRIDLRSDDPAWLSLENIGMTGKVTMRKTDNGWRAL
ncbi:hypothetical protein GCM10027082_06520 [Comamonas humi]